MPTTKRDLQALHYLAQRLREETRGAGPWHDAGLTPVLAKLEGHNLAITIERVTRHAADAEAKTPAAIERPFVPELVAPGPPRPPKPSEACRDCGRHQASCLCDDGPIVRPLPKASNPDAVARLRAIRDNTTADLCAHHVPPTNCLDCSKRSTTTTEGAPA